MRGWGDLKGLDLTTIDQKVIDRFWAKVDKTGECWVWIGSRSVQSSDRPSYRYPLFSVPGVGIKSSSAVAYALTHEGILPPNRILRRQCSTLRCVRHWKVMTTGQARADILLERTPLPVGQIRAMRRAGAACEEVVEEYPQFSHERLRSVMLNQTFPDSGYRTELKSRREEHPELCVSQEMLSEIRAEYESGTSMAKISRWSGVPLTTVWESINGPSPVRRRPVLI